MASGPAARTTFGNYRAISLLGRGGMGEVYLAEDTRLGRRVALKLLPPAFVRDEGRLRRFIQEARTASALNHPHIVTIFEIGESEGAHFIAMEYIEGETLRHRLGRSPALSRDEIFDVVIQTAAALEAAHNAGVIHRDLKPENLMLRPDGYIKVVDFGLAKVNETEQGVSAATMTMPGMVMGTAQYMSPEQARGLPIDRRSDLFSLGAVLYEALTGKSPFDGETISHQIVAVLEKEPSALIAFRSDLPLDLEFIAKKALAKKVEERYQSAQEMGADLKQLRRRMDVEAEVARLSPPQGVPSAPISIPLTAPSAPVPAAPPPQVAAARRPGRLPLLGFSVLFLVGLAVGVYFSGIGREKLPAVLAPQPPQVNITVPPPEPAPALVEAPPREEAPVPSPAAATPPPKTAASKRSAASPSSAKPPPPPPKPAEPIKAEVAKVEPVKAELPKEIPAPPPVEPQFPAAAGVYWNDGHRWAAVHSVQARIERKGRRVFGLRVGEKNRALLPGVAAALRVVDNKPRLFVRLPDAPPDRLRLVRVFKASDSPSRELRQTSVLFDSSPAPERFAFDATPAPGGGIFVTPRVLLPPGEYALADVGSGAAQTEALRFWDFGVDPKPAGR